MNSENLILETARRTIEIERETLEMLRRSIGHSFESCARAIFDSKGRLVVSGVGKSALVAKKIVATLNSTGTPSIFMHAADAIHGDLGMIRPEDQVMCISKSGETAEIKVLVPWVKNLGNAVIGMVSNLQSYLGCHADFLLHTPVPKEADPNNLAPTASTTAQIALGDALATALLAMRGFSPEDFAQFHPGGSLGKQLYLRVKEIYPSNEKPAVYLRDSIKKTIIEITSKRLGATAVLDEKQNLRGIITDGDLRRMLEKEPDIAKLSAEDIMTLNPVVIEESELAVKALNSIQKNSITQLIVTNRNGAYLGIIHLHDLLKEGLV